MSELKKVIFYPQEIWVQDKKIVYSLEKICSIFEELKLKLETFQNPLIPENLSKTELFNLAKELSLTKIVNSNLKTEEELLSREIEFEQEYFRTQKVISELYDGYKLHDIYKKFVPYKLRECHIVFTQRIISTFDNFDGRYHARVVILGYPCIISIPGLTTALAKPKEYYFIRDFADNIVAQKVKLELADKLVNLEKENLYKYLVKYILQCLFYVFEDNIFCNDKNCLFYDNHWQEEVVQQVKNICCLSDILSSLCPPHKEKFSLLI